MLDDKASFETGTSRTAASPTLLAHQSKRKRLKRKKTKKKKEGRRVSQNLDNLCFDGLSQQLNQQTIPAKRVQQEKERNDTFGAADNNIQTIGHRIDNQCCGRRIEADELSTK